MTGQQRRELASLIDQAVRARLLTTTKPVGGYCKGCGIRFEDTPERMDDTGCWHCRDRVRRKLQRAREQADEALRRRRLDAQAKRRKRRRQAGPFVGACSGCGVPYAQATVGCVNCKNRHARNRRHRPWAT